VTRRLLATLLAFTAAVLAISVVPLGVVVSQRDRDEFRTSTSALAQSLATLSEDSFDDRGPALQPSRLQTAAGPGVDVAVLGLDRQEVVRTGEPVTGADTLVAEALNGRPRSAFVGDQAVAAAPIVADGQTRGAVVVGRGDEPLEQRVRRLWLALLAIVLVALLASAVLGVGAARWVGRPIRELRTVAHEWSEGELAVRAPTASGPPEVREVAITLNSMAARLDALVNGSRAVVADVSHQLRTPLAAMRLRLELLGDELAATDSTGSAKDDVAMLLGEVARLSRLVDGLLAIARAESTQPQPASVDVLAVAAERREAWQPIASDRGVRIEVHGDADVGAALVTPGHLEQVLDNLIDNALEAVSQEGEIDIRVTRHGDRVRVAVTDDGAGMPAEVQSSAFRRFSSGRPNEGSGLGLAIVHRLVTVDGGTVALQSERGKGTTVSMDLPVARTDLRSAAPAR
jgi:signal transduction histidine kinase